MAVIQILINACHRMGRMFSVFDTQNEIGMISSEERRGENSIKWGSGEQLRTGKTERHKMPWSNSRRSTLMLLLVIAIYIYILTNSLSLTLARISFLSLFFFGFKLDSAKKWHHELGVSELFKNPRCAFQKMEPSSKIKMKRFYSKKMHFYWSSILRFEYHFDKNSNTKFCCDTRFGFTTLRSTVS